MATKTLEQAGVAGSGSGSLFVNSEQKRLLVDECCPFKIVDAYPDQESQFGPQTIYAIVFYPKRPPSFDPNPSEDPVMLAFGNEKSKWRVAEATKMLRALAEPECSDLGPICLVELAPANGQKNGARILKTWDPKTGQPLKVAAEENAPAPKAAAKPAPAVPSSDEDIPF